MMNRSRIGLIFALTFAAFLLGLVSLSISPAQAQEVGTNWTAQFFNNTAFSGSPQGAFYANGLNFNWGQGPPLQSDNITPVPGINSDNFSARFTSQQNIVTPGVYRFTIRAKDGVRITINGQVYLDQLNRQVPAGQYVEDVFNANMNAGANTMLVEYTHFTGNAVLQVQWGLSGGGVNPGITPTTEPPATGSVVYVKGLSVRTGPYLGASLITVARPDQSYAVVAQNFDEGLFPWYKIQINDSIGWASGRYLQVAGDMSKVPTEGTIFEQLGPGNLGEYPPRLNVTGVTRSVMNLRLRPSERTELLAKIPWGAEVQVYGRTYQGYDNHWLFIKYGDLVGWIYAPYVGLKGVIDAVPIY